MSGRFEEQIDEAYTVNKCKNSGTAVLSLHFPNVHILMLHKPVNRYTCVDVLVSLASA